MLSTAPDPGLLLVRTDCSDDGAWQDHTVLFVDFSELNEQVSRTVAREHGLR